jgi:hypothetical protein
MQQLDFFNTINLEGEELATAKAKALSQEDRIMQIMPHGTALTPFEVHVLWKVKFKDVPITSIRRAMTNLSDKGKLEKTAHKRAGGYGTVNYTWKRI